MEVEESDGPLCGTLAEVNVVEYEEVVDTRLEVPRILDVLDNERIRGMCSNPRCLANTIRRALSRR